MKRSSIRWLFGLVIVIFSAELLLAYKVTEPYPAIIYPSFADIPSFNSVIQKPRIVVFFDNQDSLEIDKEAFFYNMSNVYNNVILTKNFNGRESFLAPSKERKTLQATVGSRRMILDLEEVWDEAQTQDGKSWIAHTLRNILERDDFTRLEVQWYNYKLTQDEEEPLRQSELAERFVLNFTH